MSNFILLIGFLLGGTIRGILIGAIVILISLFFTHLPVNHPIVVIAMGTLAAMVFSLGGLINAIYAKRFDDISFILRTIQSIIEFISGYTCLVKNWTILYRLDIYL